MRTYGGVVSIDALASDLMKTDLIHTGEWQSMDTSKSNMHATHELEDVTFHMGIPVHAHALDPLLQPDQPWAEMHFMERVSGIPYNPPPSAASWPYAVRGHADHTDPKGRFDHTYPERFWPKRAATRCPTPENHLGLCNGTQHYDRSGIRFAYGDLSDVVSLLVRSPLTRQAYLPVWFPEDTGAVAGQRVPCTLGYHFMIRDGRLSCRYYIRSCDMRRHFINDVYFACRLTQWICDAFNDMRAINGEPPITRHMPGELTPGRLVMHITSLHCFVGDHEAIRERFIKPWTFREASAEGIPS